MFSLQPTLQPMAEAESFLRQMADETGGAQGLAQRLDRLRCGFARTGTWQPSSDELTFGARLAWRNSVRCVGRMFWPSLKVFDARAARTAGEMYLAILDHIDWATNGGDIRPAITIFTADGPKMRILNGQLILYAGHVQSDGSILGDPKNIGLTRLAKKLGWKGAGTPFDVLPLVLRIGEDAPQLFEIPPEKILSVKIRHPDCAAIAALGLQWFALPAVANMALDMGGRTSTIRVDGGMARSDWTMQRLADISGCVVDRPEVTETTALGAAWLAGHQSGLLPGPGEAAPHWRLERRFMPQMSRPEAKARHGEWLGAVRGVLGSAG
jgi:nitric-oxide synthase